MATSDHAHVTEVRAHYDSALFARLTAAYRAGELGDREVRLADRELFPMAEASSYADDAETLAADGQAAIARGEVAAVVLAGGLATRFGGRAKASVDLTPGWPLLRIKLEQISRAAEDARGRIAASLLVSRNSHDAVTKIVEQHADDWALDVTVIQQAMLPRLTPEGEEYHDAKGRRSFSPTGHGDAVRLAGDQCRLPEHADVRHIFFSNIDNLLGTLLPEAVGLQRKLGVNLIEAAPSEQGDAGGTLVRGAHGAEVIEGFRITDDVPPHPWLLSTNTMWLLRQTVVDPPHLPWNAVHKKAGEDPVVQFEQLMGEVSEFRPFQPVRVDRLGPNGRFSPLKVQDDFTRLQEPIIEVLSAQGLKLEP